MAVTEWIDKSALVRLADSPNADLWAERIERGLVRITTVIRLEVGYSARTGEDTRSIFASPPFSSMPVEYLTPTIEDRAVQVQLLLAGQGQACHRHDWMPGLPAHAEIYLDELPPRPRPLPRFIPEFVMAQLEDPANLARLPDQSTRNLIILLQETGLRPRRLRPGVQPDHPRQRPLAMSEVLQPQDGHRAAPPALNTSRRRRP